MTKPYARGATRGGGRSDIFLGLGSKKTPEHPLRNPKIRSHKWVPFSIVRYPQLSDIEALEIPR